MLFTLELAIVPFNSWIAAAMSKLVISFLRKPLSPLKSGISEVDYKITFSIETALKPRFRWLIEGGKLYYLTYVFKQA
jgi:hypothetical protein